MKHGVDFSLWEQGGTVVMALSGPLDAATVQLLRARLEEMAQPDRAVVLDLLRVPSVDDEAILALLSLQSDLKGKGTEIVLVATSPEVLGKVAPYRQLFSVHPSVQSLLATGFQTKGVRWSRRTGFRMAAPVAAFLALLLAGWMGTLLLVVVWQFRELRQSSAQVELLRAQTVREQSTIEELEKRLKPLEDLGLLEKPKPRRKKPRTSEGGSDSTAAPVEPTPTESPAESP